MGDARRFCASEGDYKVSLRFKLLPSVTLNLGLHGAEVSDSAWNPDRTGGYLGWIDSVSCAQVSR